MAEPLPRRHSRHVQGVLYTQKDYGMCPCGGSYAHRAVEVRMTVNGKIVVLTDVPQGACPSCGSRVYKPEVLERIESLMKTAQFKRAI